MKQLKGAAIITLQILALIIVSPLIIAGLILALVIWFPLVLLSFGLGLFDP